MNHRKNDFFPCSNSPLVLFHQRYGNLLYRDNALTERGKGRDIQLKDRKVSNGAFVISSSGYKRPTLVNWWVISKISVAERKKGRKWKEETDITHVETMCLLLPVFTSFYGLSQNSHSHTQSNFLNFTEFSFPLISMCAYVVGRGVVAES